VTFGTEIGTSAEIHLATIIKQGEHM